MACLIPSHQIRQNLERSARDKGLGSPFELGGRYKPGSHIGNPTVENGDLMTPAPSFYFACPPDKSYFFSVGKRKEPGRRDKPSGLRLQDGFLPYRDITADTSEHTWYRAAQLQQTQPDICKKVNKRPNDWEDLYEYFDGEDIYHMGAYNAWCVVNLLFEMNLHINEEIETEWKNLMDIALGEWLANFDDAKDKLLAFDRHKTTRSILTVLEDASNLFDLDGLTRNQKAILAIRTGLLREKLLAQPTERSSMTLAAQPRSALQIPESAHDHYAELPLSAPAAVSYFQTQSTQPHSPQIPASKPAICSVPSGEIQCTLKEKAKGDKSDYPKTPEHGRSQSNNNHIYPTKMPVFLGSHSPNNGGAQGSVSAPSLPGHRGASAPLGLQTNQQYPVAVTHGFQGPQMQQSLGFNMQPLSVRSNQHHPARFTPPSSAGNMQSYNHNQQQVRSRHVQQPSNGALSQSCSRNSSTSPQKNGSWEPRDVPNSIHGPVVCRPGSRRDSTCHDGDSNLSLNSEIRHASSSSVLEDRQHFSHGQNNGQHHPRRQPCLNLALGPNVPSVKCDCHMCCHRSRSIIICFEGESVTNAHLDDLRRIFSHWGQIEFTRILSGRRLNNHQVNFDMATIRFRNDSVPPTVIRDISPTRPIRLGNNIVRVMHPKGSKYFLGYQKSPTRRRTSATNGVAPSGPGPSHERAAQANSSMPSPSWPINDKQVNGSIPNSFRLTQKPGHVGQVAPGRDQQQQQHINVGPVQGALPTPPLSAKISMPPQSTSTSMHNMPGLTYHMAPMPGGFSTYAHNQPPFNSVTTYPSAATAPLLGQTTFAYHPQPGPHNPPPQICSVSALHAAPTVAAVPDPVQAAKPIVVASANVEESIACHTKQGSRHNSIKTSRESSPTEQLPHDEIQVPLPSSSINQLGGTVEGESKIIKGNELKKVPAAIATECIDKADSGMSTANSSFVILTPNSSFNSASNEDSPSRTLLEPDNSDRGMIDYGTVRIKKNVRPSPLPQMWLTTENDMDFVEVTAIEPSLNAEKDDVVTVPINPRNVEGLQATNGRPKMPAHEKPSAYISKFGSGEVPTNAGTDGNPTGTPPFGDHEQRDVSQKQGGPKKGKNKKKNNRTKHQQGLEITSVGSVTDHNEVHFAAHADQNHTEGTGAQGHDGPEKKQWKKNKRNYKKTAQVQSEMSDGSRTMSLVSGPSGRATPEPAAGDTQAGNATSAVKSAAGNEPSSPSQETAGLYINKTRAGRETAETIDRDNIPVINRPSDQTGPNSSPFASQKDEIARQLNNHEPAPSSVMCKPPAKPIITQTSKNSTLPAGFDPFPRFAPLRAPTPVDAAIADKQDQRKLPPAPAGELTPPATPEKDTSFSRAPVQANRVELPPSPPSPTGRQLGFNPNAQVFVSEGPRQSSHLLHAAAAKSSEQQESKKFQKKKKKTVKKPQKQHQEKSAAPAAGSEFMNSTNWRASSHAAKNQRADSPQKMQEAAKSQGEAAAVSGSTANGNDNAASSLTPSASTEPAYKKGDKLDVGRGETFLKHRFNVMSELMGRPQKEERSKAASSVSSSAHAQTAMGSSMSSSSVAKTYSADNKKPLPPPGSYKAWPSLPSSRSVTERQPARSSTPQGSPRREGKKKASPVSSEKSGGTAGDGKGPKGATSASSVLGWKLMQHKSRALSSAN